MAGMRFPESRDSVCKSHSGNTGSRDVAMHNGCYIGDSESSCITDNYESNNPRAIIIIAIIIGD